MDSNLKNATSEVQASKEWKDIFARREQLIALKILPENRRPLMMRETYNLAQLLYKISLKYKIARAALIKGVYREVKFT